MPITVNLTGLQSVQGTEIKTNIRDVEFLEILVNEHLKSDKLKFLKEADEYYKNRNVVIMEKVNYIYGENGKKEVATNFTNTKNAHAFMKKLVNQKASYLCGKPFSYKTEQSKLAEILPEYFNRKFYLQMLQTAKNAIKGGLAWMQVYYTEDGKLAFKRIPTEELYPLWKDGEHTELEAMLRIYEIIEYGQGGVKTTIRKVEYYDYSGVYYFMLTKDGKLVYDPEREGNGFYAPHFVVSVDKEEVIKNEETGEDEIVKKEVIEGRLWDKLPFVCFKYNDEELGILTWVKDLIDNYDMISSKTSDKMQDSPDNLLIIEGYKGTEKEAFAKNINLFRSVFVDLGGKVTSLQKIIDINAINSHLTRLRKDIYEFGGGVDGQIETNFPASGIALKMRFSDLDLDAKFMSTHFSGAMENLLWFICRDVEARENVDLDETEVDITFNTDMTINETEVIANINASARLLSTKTQLDNHPYVTDVEQELEAKEKENKELRGQLGDITNGTKPQGEEYEGSEEGIEDLKDEEE